jgi:hypothetical protein
VPPHQGGERVLLAPADEPVEEAFVRRLAG